MMNSVGDKAEKMFADYAADIRYGDFLKLFNDLDMFDHGFYRNEAVDLDRLDREHPRAGVLYRLVLAEPPCSTTLSELTAASDHCLAFIYYLAVRAMGGRWFDFYGDWRPPALENFGRRMP